MLLDHVVLEVLPRAVLSPAQLARLPRAACVKLLVSCQHAPVKESLVAKVTGEPRRHPSGVQGGPTPASPHSKWLWTPSEKQGFGGQKSIKIGTKMGPKMGPFSGPCFMLVFWLGGGFETS